MQLVDGFLTWVPPVVYARNIGLVCNAIDFEPVGSYDATISDFADWFVTLHFGIPDAPGNEDVADISLSTGGEELVVPNSNFTNTNTDEKLTSNDAQITLLIPKTDINCQF